MTSGRIHVITGSASGIGQATATRLRAAGHRVIGVDLRDADIIADLTSEQGRQHMVERVRELAPDGIDGVLAGAGIAHPVPATVALNHFGAVATLEGLRPLLARKTGARAVAICSTAALLPVDPGVVEACLAGDEARALELTAANPMGAYTSSKQALSLWLRRQSVTREWAGSGILLNGVAPGVVLTAMTEPVLADPQLLAMVRQTNPIAVEGYAQPDELAELIAFLLTFKGHYLVGQVIFNDGGTDALMRPTSF